MVIKCKKNYYDILGVTPDSSENDVKGSYRKLARKYHPDINKSPESTAKFKDILEAYETLSDSVKRKQYDMVNGFYKTPKDYFKETSSQKQADIDKDSFEKSETRKNKTQKNGCSEKSAAEKINKKIFKDKVNTILEEFSKNSKKSEQIPKNGSDVNTEISISLSEAINGAERILNVIHKELCPNCKGRRFINDSRCPKCNGVGTFEIKRKLTVKIPSGVKDNTKLRLSSEGNPGFFGGKNGDLYIKIKIKDDSEYKIAGDNLLHTVYISPFEAVLGTELNILAFNDFIKLTIPPMTQSGQKFQISGKGVKTNGKFGDMIITVLIQIPKNLSEDEKILYGKLKKMSVNGVRE